MTYSFMTLTEGGINMHLKKIIAVTLMLMLAVSSFVFAGELSVAVNERILSAEGNCGNGNENVSILVLPSDVTPELLDSLEGDLLSKVIYMGRAVLNNGVLEESIPLPERMETGSYTLYVIGNTEISEKEFSFKNPDDIKRLVELIQGTDDEEEFFESVVSSSADLGIRADEFKEITGKTERKALMTAIQENMKLQEGTPSEKFRNAFYIIVTEYLLEGEYNGEMLKAYSRNYFKNAGIDEAYINLIIEESLEDELAEKMENQKYEGIADIEEKLMLNSFLVRFAAGETKGIRFSVYEDYGREKLGLSKSIFGGYSEQAVIDKFTTNKFSDITGFENEIKKAVNALKNASGSTGGGGGGGGGGVSSGKIEYTPKEPVKEDKEEIKEEKVSFADMADYSWAKSQVELLAEKGIISKAKDGRFRPADFITREEFVKMLVTALDVKAEGDISFADVTEDMWCYSYIKAGYAAGLIKGISAESFGRGKNITRQDIAVILERAISKYKIETAKVNQAKNFIDENEISDYAGEAVKLMGEYGIINGYEDGSFRPSGFATRAETAVLISQIIK